jgi:hypothetical protein
MFIIIIFNPNFIPVKYPIIEINKYNKLVAKKKGNGEGERI